MRLLEYLLSIPESGPGCEKENLSRNIVTSVTSVTAQRSSHEVESGDGSNRNTALAETGARFGGVVSIHPTEINPTLSHPAAIPQSECKHCDGAGVCNCPACNLRRTTDAVPCLMCHPLERQVWLAATRPEGCWHCSGSGKCKCISCDNATCGVCGGSGKTRVN
jgi:hypothetical protein